MPAEAAVMSKSDSNLVMTTKIFLFPFLPFVLGCGASLALGSQQIVAKNILDYKQNLE